VPNFKEIGLLWVYIYLVADSFKKYIGFKESN